MDFEQGCFKICGFENRIAEQEEMTDSKRSYRAMDFRTVNLDKCCHRFKRDTVRWQQKVLTPGLCRTRSNIKLRLLD